MEENREKLLIKFEMHARKNKIRLNPNGEIIEGMINGLLKNKELRGEIYCPCRILIGNKKEDKKIICPCVFHKKEIKEEGHCKCNLFIK
jgi:ferredoxin-thioredoxin reductase catalytic subunit|tara:strand:+ start:3940 stop:4206 length:267 start_codon:yes stop_codon:yes gene_type:complete